jgi:hypothetical protein
VQTDGDERVPEPVEGEQLRLDTIARLSTLAKTESLLVAQYERDQLSLSDAGASTLLALDSQLAWLSGDVLLADQLLQRLKNGNTVAIDFALEEQIAQAALSGQCFAPPPYSLKNPGRQQNRKTPRFTAIDSSATSSESPVARCQPSSKRLGNRTGELGWKCNWLIDRDPVRYEPGKALLETDRKPQQLPATS